MWRRGSGALFFYFSRFAVCEFGLITPSTTVRIIYGLSCDDNACWLFVKPAEKKTWMNIVFRCGSFKDVEGVLHEVV